MRYMLKISYDGTNYFGYQKQLNRITIQEILEKTMTEVINAPIDIVASGRTDSGVSAIEQICHFDCDNEIDVKRVVGHANSILPQDIRVHDIVMVDKEFHARFSAKRKTYEYYFYTNTVSVPVYEKSATFVGYNIDIDKMIKACKYIKGTHDFSAFSASNTNVLDKVRTIFDIDIKQVDDRLYKLVITGNGFLYNMVRIIMGTLIDVGRGKIALEEMPKIIENGNRQKAGKTISAKGLYLKKVEY